MAVTFDTASSVRDITGGLTQITWQHNTGGGSNPAMTIEIGYGGAGGISSVTYNGAASTFITSNSDTGQLWGLAGPDSGDHDIVVDFASVAFDGIDAGAKTFFGVDQGTPFGVGVNNFAGPGGETDTPTVNVSAEVGDLVTDVICYYNLTSTAGAGQTEQWKIPVTQPDADSLSAAGSTEPGDTAVTMSWTLSGAAQWSICAVAVKAGSVEPPPSDDEKIVSAAFMLFF